jgi:tetratricopeptide (TPR) repeat protein
MDKQTDKQRDLAKTFVEKGYHLQMLGHLDRAIHFYKRSIEFYPTAKAYTFWGWALSLKGLLDEAIEKCRQAIAIDPGYGNPYNDIGAYLMQQRKFDEAIPWLNKALQASNYENYCYPYLNLGRIYEMKGFWDKALDCYKKALAENARYLPAQTAHDQLMGKYN